MSLKVVCFPNGNVAVFKDAKQVPDAQQPWLVSVAENMVAAGLDPLEAEVLLPDGKKAKFFQTDSAWNWVITEE